MLAPRLPLGPAGLLLLLLLLLFQLPPPGRPDPEANCDPDGCYALYSQPRSFLEAWRACREQGGNLATLKRAEEAAQVSQLLAGSRQPGPPRLFWIGLQRQPRQCFPQRPLRGFSWVTGEQETAYSNWARGVGAAAGAAGCAAPRCVALDDRDFQWLEGSCAGPVDGYLCRFAFRGMCAGLEAGEEGASVAYEAPFGQLAASASAVGAPPRFVPFGTVASVGCPAGASLLSLLCLQKEDGRVGWSKNPPLCRDPWCEGDNGGCQQLCVDEGSGYACECHAGYLLLPDGHSCAAHDPCRHRPCQFDCVAEEEEEESGDGYRCRCPAGYELASDGHQCEDLDECVEAPCEHQCENTEGSFLCRCHLGFSPAEDEPGQCVDTDECQIPGVCQQMCVNYVGGFECYCTEGFDLEADGISCSPVDGLDGPDATPPEAWLDDPSFHQERHPVLPLGGQPVGENRPDRLGQPTLPTGHLPDQCVNPAAAAPGGGGGRKREMALLAPEPGGHTRTPTLANAREGFLPSLCHIWTAARNAETPAGGAPAGMFSSPTAPHPKLGLSPKTGLRTRLLLSKETCLGGVEGGEKPFLLQRGAPSLACDSCCLETWR
uniref:CD248 molecule n=1 Tax=Laticauda laticaudata TaxID=8630 RepID=A0A8C5SEH4_LATLA